MKYCKINTAPGFNSEVWIQTHTIRTAVSHLEVHISDTEFWII